jgi:hypothetical protein
MEYKITDLSHQLPHKQYASWHLDLDLDFDLDGFSYFHSSTTNKHPECGSLLLFSDIWQSASQLAHSKETANPSKSKTEQMQ